MKRYKTLFKKHLQGLLSQEEVASLHKQLIAEYFESPWELDPDERIYAEELLFESGHTQNLDPLYQKKFEEKIQSDRSFRQRFHLASGLLDASLASQPPTETDTSEKVAEEELKAILGEVLEKVHIAEDRPSLGDQIKSMFLNFLGATKEKIVNLLHPAMPGLRYAYAFGVIGVLGFIIWFVAFPPGPRQIKGPGIANNTTSIIIHLSKGKANPEKGKSPLATTRQQDLNQATKVHTPKSRSPLTVEMKRVLLSKIVSNLFQAAGNFEVALTRGQTNAVTDSLLVASDKYNAGDYPSCMRILDQMNRSNPALGEDTASQLNFYLGNCQFTEGISQQNDSLIECSIASFSGIQPGSPFYNSARWYQALGNAFGGKTDEALRVIDSLESMGQDQDGKMKKLKATLKDINSLPKK